MPSDFQQRDLLLLRELRWHTRRELARRLQSALVSATLRLPHGLRRREDAARAFSILCDGFGGQLAAAGGRRVLATSDADGPALHWAVPDAAMAKRLAIAMEEAPGGELLDLDVMASDGTSISREDLGLPSRPCLLCGRRPAALCISLERHGREQTERAFLGALAAVSPHESAEKALADRAQRALLYEALLSPKPGLVDRDSAGAHRDMDIHRFIDSAVSLHPFFQRFARAGMDRAAPPEGLLARLRPIGMEAEREMLRVTGGVNTHRGAIFSLGILCAAARGEGGGDSDAVCAMAGRIASPALRDAPSSSHGALAGRLYGAPGARGEAAQGFPAARSALARLRDALRHGMSLERAQLTALYHIMSQLEDSNLLYRGGLGGLHFVQRGALRLLEEGLPEAGMAAFGAEMALRRLSPGGAADVLAQALFLHMLEEMAVNRANSPCGLV